jgi:ribosomal protein S6--L-glutamate ligase
MKICLLAESVQNPVLAGVVQELAVRHSVVVSDPQSLTEPLSPGSAAGSRDADLYLLKSRTPIARSVARRAERAGATVINSPSATSAALNRRTTAKLLQRANVPAPRTWAFDTLAQLALPEHVAAMPWPLVVKSRISRRGDLVRLVHREDVQELLAIWGNEPVIAQEFVPNDGFDIKFWVINGQVWAARRPAALESRDKSRDVRIDSAELPDVWVQAALRAGQVLGLDLFGVDIILTDRGPLVIDVNAFPGFQGVPNAAQCLVNYVENVAEDRRLIA